MKAPFVASVHRHLRKMLRKRTIGVIMPNTFITPDGLISAPGSSYVRLISRMHQTYANGIKYKILDLSSLKSDLFGVDAVIVQRNAISLEQVNVLFEVREMLHFKICYEIDDDLLNISENKHLGQVYQQSKDAIRELLCRSDLVLVSTQYLFNKYSGYNSRVHITKNLLSAKIWNDESPVNTVLPVVSDRDINAIYMGTFSHGCDLQIIRQPFLKAKEKYPNLKLFLIGVQAENEDWFTRIDIPRGYGLYPNFVKWFKSICRDMDFAVAPLETNEEFNYSKSGLKYLEYSAAGLPAIFSNSLSYREYIVDNTNGLMIANDFDSWYKAICFYSSSPDERDRIVNNAYSDVMKNYMIGETAPEFDRLLIDCIDS
jgi:glycosyltransferase involved in cell wall biosynthesis